MIEQLVSLTLMAIMHIVCFYIMTVRKYSAKKTVFIYSLYIAVFICLAIIASKILFYIHSLHAISFAFVSTFLTAFFIFMATSADPVCKKVFLFLCYSTMFCIFYCSSVIVSSIWFRDELGAAAVYTKAITRILLYLPAIWAYIRFLRPAMRDVPSSNKKVWYSISLVSMLFLIVFSVFLVVHYMENDFRAWHSILFVITVVIYCSVLWVIFDMIRYMKKESRTELIEKNMDYLQEQLKIARDNELFAKTIRHDFRHHNQNIAVMLKKGEIGETLRYIEQYNKSLDAVKPREFCPNVTVNAILTNFYHIAHNKGILFYAYADTPYQSPIADMDFVAILSNLLENAVNGCKECKVSMEIKINIRTIENKTVIVCSNSCRENIEIVNHMIKNKGVGIDSIVASSRKYNGDISYKQDNGILTVCVILKS